MMKTITTVVNSYHNDLLDLAYAVGFIDGEGCIDYKSTRRGWMKYRYIRLRANNTNEEVLLWLEDKFGGSTTSRKVYNDNKPQWVWTLDGTPTVKSFLRKIEPYLIVKRNQVRRALGL